MNLRANESLEDTKAPAEKISEDFTMSIPFDEQSKKQLTEQIDQEVDINGKTECL